MKEKNRIYNCDCLEGIKSLESGSVDLFVTSPPYNIGANYSMYEDKKPLKDYLLWMGDIALASYAVLKDGAGSPERWWDFDRPVDSPSCCDIVF